MSIGRVPTTSSSATVLGGRSSTTAAYAQALSRAPSFRAVVLSLPGSSLEVGRNDAGAPVVFHTASRHPQLGLWIVPCLQSFRVWSWRFCVCAPLSISRSAPARLKLGASAFSSR